MTILAASCAIDVKLQAKNQGDTSQGQEIF
jgi:hypothetical protein